MKWVKTELGNEFQCGDYLMFFGNKNSSPERLREQYPNFEFRYLKQVHGDKCIKSENEESEADAHYTDEKNVALCIRTADCNPILIGSHERICAIHAGWRGVRSRILEKSIEKVFGSIPQDARLAIGPHIQKNSFQVDFTLSQEFASEFGESFVFQKEGEPDKAYVDLKAILISGLESSFASIWVSDEDTLSSNQYYSHRRDPQNKGRNISFVARL